jgi:hypothetical protein
VYKVITPARLNTIIKSGEKLKVDFKKSYDLSSNYQKDEFTKDVTAIANTPGGRGFLLYGVTDGGNVAGISPSRFSEEQMQQVISHRCDPPVKFLAYTLRHSGLYVGIIEIPSSINRPHQHLIKGALFIRRGTTTDHMSMQEISSAILRRRQIEKHALGVYDSSSPTYRVQQIKRDIIDIFQEFGFENSRETQESFMTYGTGIRTVVDTEIGNSGKKIRFHATVYGDAVTHYDIQRFRYLTSKALDNVKIKKNSVPWLNIRLIASYESISKNSIKGYQQDQLTTTVNLDGSTYYYGLGDVAYASKRTPNSMGLRGKFLPEFYLTRVRSAEDIRTRISMIFDYINEKSEIFNIMRKSQSEPK